MHLAEAAADGRDDGLTIGEQVGFFRFIGLGSRELVQRAREMVENPGPGVALVANKTKRNSKGARRPVCSDPNDVAIEPRRMGKPLLGEVAAHLCLGMNAGRDAAIDLYHQRVADRERAVGLLRAKPIDLAILYGCEDVAARPPSGEILRRRQHGGTLGRSARLSDKSMGETRQRKGIRQKSDATSRAARVRGQVGWVKLPTVHPPRESPRAAATGFCRRWSCTSISARSISWPVAADVGQVGDALRIRCADP